MFLRATLGLYLKDYPKGHMGMTSESWTFNGKNVTDPKRWHTIFYMMFRSVLEFWFVSLHDERDVEAINGEIRELAEMIRGTQLEKNGDAET